MTESNGFDIEIASSDDGTEARVQVSGEIDSSNAHEVHSVVAVLAGWDETQRVVVDLSAVTFMDSSGISALLLCLGELRKMDRALEVVGAQGPALRVLELTGVIGMLSPPSVAATNPTA